MFSMCMLMTLSMPWQLCLLFALKFRGKASTLLQTALVAEVEQLFGPRGVLAPLRVRDVVAVPG